MRTGGVAGRHGYRCNLMLRYRRVSAVFSFFHTAVSTFIHPFAVLICTCCVYLHPLTCCPHAPVAILSALRNLQMKIRRLELEKRQAELSMQTMRREASHTHTHLQRDQVTQTPQNDPTGVEQETSVRPSCNQGGCGRQMRWRISDLRLYAVYGCPQRWSPIWLLQSRAARGWSDSWKS